MFNSFVRFASFFFFKQKTAYEMRISDWSSDVCSSDLRPTATRFREIKELVAVFGHRPRTSLGIGPQHSHPFRMELQFLQRAVHRRITGLTFDVGIKFRGREAGSALITFQLGHVDAVRRKAAHRRSEEHTSELQSLMRISYAVFGMKKKKL